MHFDSHKIKDRILLGKACNDGCQASLAEIHSKHQASILAYLRKRLPNHNITEDICQSVFMQIHEGKCKYDGSSEVKSYLFGVAGNLCKQELKKENAKTFNQDQIQVDDDLLVQKSTQDDPHEVLENEESLQSLRAAIAQLPSKSRQMIELVSTVPLT